MEQVKAAILAREFLESLSEEAFDRVGQLLASVSEHRRDPS